MREGLVERLRAVSARTNDPLLLEAADALEAAQEDTARLNYIELAFSGMTNRERYLPVQMIWGKGCNGRTLRQACDKYRSVKAPIAQLRESSETQTQTQTQGCGEVGRIGGEPSRIQQFGEPVYYLYTLLVEGAPNPLLTPGTKLYTAPPSAPVGVPVDVVREYLDARACYEEATRRPNSHAPAPALKHGDPAVLRLREARVALDNAIALNPTAAQEKDDGRS